MRAARNCVLYRKEAHRRSPRRFGYILTQGRVVQGVWCISFERQIGFDLSHAVFTVGSQLTKQKQGAPIGGIMSTSRNCYLRVLRNCCCFDAWCWCALFACLYNMRYVDDITGVVAFLKNDSVSFARPKAILKRLLTECYPKENWFWNQNRSKTAL